MTLEQVDFVVTCVLYFVLGFVAAFVGYQAMLSRRVR